MALSCSEFDPERDWPYSDCERVAFRTLFEGDWPLYRGFRSACVEQFGQDLRLVHELLRLGPDWPALRRMAHSLKGVLLTLGYQDLGALALALQEQAQAADAGAAIVLQAYRGDWLELQQGMVQAFDLQLPEPLGQDERP